MWDRRHHVRRRRGPAGWTSCGPVAHLRGALATTVMTQPTLPPRDADLQPSSAPPPKPEKASLFDDFLDIFYAPSSVFARRANASFWVPLLIITVLLGVIFIANRDVMEPIMEAEMTRALAKAGSTQQLTPEQLEAGRKIGGTLATVGAFVITPIGILLLGLATWIVGKFVDAKQTLNAAFVVATFANVPRIVQGIFVRVQGLFIDPSTLTSQYSLSFGAGRFFDPDTTSPLLLALIGRIDVFTIWVTVLVAIGLAVTGKISRGRAAIAAVVVWLLGALPAVAAALR